MTQLQQVINQLEATGSVSRNWCLQRYNTRLGARIIDLKRMGWKFKTSKKDGDYIYTLIEHPTKDVGFEKPSAGIESPKPTQQGLTGLNFPSHTNLKSHYDY